MKIIITQTTIVFDLPDEPQPAKPQPTRPNSFFDWLYREIERTAEPDYLETQHHGTFLPQ